jgi:hypothetical protein
MKCKTVVLLEVQGDGRDEQYTLIATLDVKLKWKMSLGKPNHRQE